MVSQSSINISSYVADGGGKLPKVSVVWTRRGFLGASAVAGFTWLWPTCSQAAPLPFPVRYRKASPYESLRTLIKAGNDVFTVEAEAAACAERWNRALVAGSVALAEDFRGSTPLPTRYKQIEGNVSLAEFNKAEFDKTDRAFANWLKTWIARLGEIHSARFFTLSGNRLRFHGVIDDGLGGVSTGATAPSSTSGLGPGSLGSAVASGPVRMPRYTK